MQFLGDVAAHLGLSALMMALVLGAFPPAVAPAVEKLVLLLFISDEVRTFRFLNQVQHNEKFVKKRPSFFKCSFGRIYILNTLLMASND